jgi:hypothetical protein
MLKYIPFFKKYAQGTCSSGTISWRKKLGAHRAHVSPGAHTCASPAMQIGRSLPALPRGSLSLDRLAGSRRLDTPASPCTCPRPSASAPSRPRVLAPRVLSLRLRRLPLPGRHHLVVFEIIFEQHCI